MIEDLINMILKHDRVIIITEPNESLDRLLKIIMNYIGKDNYIEHNDDTELFEDFLTINKHHDKRIVSTTLNVRLSNPSITNSVFDDAKFILPYRNMIRSSGLPHFPGNPHLPTKLLYKSDLVMSINQNILSIDKIRNASYEYKINLENLFTSERNIKIRKLQKLIV